MLPFSQVLLYIIGLYLMPLSYAADSLTSYPDEMVFYYVIHSAGNIDFCLVRVVCLLRRSALTRHGADPHQTGNH